MLCLFEQANIMQHYLIDPILLQDFSKILEILKYMAEASIATVVILYCMCAIGYLFYRVKEWFKK